MRQIKKFTILFLLFVALTSCAVLPKTLNENNTVVVAHCRWISKFGKKTISQGAAKPIIRNLATGRIFKANYKKKTYTYFYKLTPGRYVIDELVLDGGNVKLHMDVSGKTRDFTIDSAGVYYIGGLDIVDYQFRFEYNVHDSIQMERDHENVLNVLNEKTSISKYVKMKTENVFLEEKW